MQSMEPRRFAVPGIGIALIIASAALMVGILSTGFLIDIDSGSNSAKSVTGSPQQRSITEQERILEMQRTQSDNGETSAPQPAIVDGKERTISSVRSYDDMRYLEMNIDLPGTANPTVRSYDEMRFLEMNLLPGDSAPYYPIPAEHQSANSELNY